MSETVLKVGSHEQFTTINAAILAADAAGGNADIQVDAGIYYNDGGYINDGINNVTIEGVGGDAVIVDPGYNAGGKAAIVTGGDNIVLKNLDISEVQVPDANGAAVRYDQGTLVLDNVHFHDNQNGILGGADPNGTITVSNSEFDHNGIDGGNGHTHDLYIGDIASFTIQNSYIHDANIGHEIKSRAENNVILNNVIADNSGTASYDIDLPNGGNATITGNTIEQGPNTQNSSINAYGEEGASNAGNTVVFSNNTVVNDGPNGALWTGGGTTISGTGNTLYNAGNLGIATGLSDTQTATARPSVSGTSFQDVLPVYSGTDTITVNLSEDQYQGDALATIYVDGQALARNQAVTASHGLGQTEAFTYQVAAAPSHVVSAQFENDAYGGDASADRNLYIDSVSVNGAAIPGTAASEPTNETLGFQVTGSGSNAPTPAQGKIDPITGGSTTNGGSGSGDSGLVLDISEDAWQGDAEFTVSVDGQQVGGTYTATASHAAGQTEAFAIPTTLDAGTHDVAISFINDAYGGSPDADRNLYVDGVAFGGQTAANSTAVLYSDQTQDVGFTVPSGTPTPTPTPAPTPTPTGSGLVLDVSEEGWKGDAQFTVSVDGQQVGGTYTATAPHDAGQTEAFAIPVTLTPGTHDVGVSFINDAYGGSPTTDRNLFVDGIALNGQAIPDSTANIWSDGTQNFSVAMPAPTQTGGLVLDMSEDAWQGDAQFTVSVDGQQVGGTYTATAAHGAGQTEAFAIPVNLTPGAHDVDVSFINDAYGGAPSADRNLYVDGIALNGQTISGSTATLWSDQTNSFNVTMPDPAPADGLVLDLSEDAWQGDAQFTVSVDGQQVGDTYTATASHGVGQTQAFSILAALAAGTHQIGVTFLNDAYGGSPSTDRNLYLDSATLNGQPLAGASTTLYDNGTFNFSVVIPTMHS